MKKGNPNPGEWFYREREAEETEWYREKREYMEKEFPEPPKREKRLIEHLRKEMPEYVPEKPPEQPPEKPSEKPSRKPMRRKEILEYIARTGIDVYLIWKPLNEKIDKIDPAKNPSITYDEQIEYLENEVIPWATEEEAIKKEELAEKAIEELKVESRRRRAKIVKEYGDVIDIITEEVLRRLQSVLGTGALPVQKPPETYYKPYEEMYEKLDSVRKSMLKDILRELMK
jgi:hypothetical protein